jgi:hypothetical protein
LLPTKSLARWDRLLYLPFPDVDVIDGFLNRDVIEGSVSGQGEFHDQGDDVKEYYY